MKVMSEQLGHRSLAITADRVPRGPGHRGWLAVAAVMAWWYCSCLLGAAVAECGVQPPGVVRRAGSYA